MAEPTEESLPSESEISECRLCLGKTISQSKSILQELSHYTALVYSITGVKVSKECDVPSEICNNCFCILGIIDNFKATILKSEKIIQKRKTESQECVDLWTSFIRNEEIPDPDRTTDKISKDESSKRKSPKILRKSNRKELTEVEVGKTCIRKSSRNSALKRSNKEDQISHEWIVEEEKMTIKKASKKANKGVPLAEMEENHEIEIKQRKTLKPEFECPAENCSKTFPTTPRLKSHHFQCHENIYKYTCEICDKKFKVHTSFLIHKSYHYDPDLPCNVCGKLLRNKRALRKHMMSHTGERAFACNSCPKTFQTRYNLQAHERSHKGEKKFKCTLCSKRFLHNCNLKYHMIHGHRTIANGAKDVQVYRIVTNADGEDELLGVS